MTKPIDWDPIYGRRAFDADIIERCCRWYITYRLSYRDLETIMAERGVHALGYSLSTLARIVDTTFSNIQTPDDDSTIGRFHRTVLAERFNPSDLPAYDRFMREESIQF